jgi:hypothetical protein
MTLFPSSDVYSRLLLYIIPDNPIRSEHIRLFYFYSVSHRVNVDAKNREFCKKSQKSEKLAKIGEEVRKTANTSHA